MDKETINLLVNGGVTTVIGVVIIVMCYWIFKLLLDQQLESRKAGFQKDIEHYKNELEKEKNAFLIKIEQDRQRFQYELDKQFTEHNVLFSALNVERFKITNKIFALLIKYYDYCKSYTDEGYLDWDYNDVYELSAEHKYEEGYGMLEQTRLDLWNIFAPNRLYFSNSLSIKIKQFIDLLNTEVDLYRNRDRGEKVYGVSQSHLNISLAIIDLNEIEDEFRKLLSVR